jgi:organic hydroperoxide reductase OsmC/OhrA
MITVHLRSLPDTEAAVGWAGGHGIVVDRPNGRAGGQGLGFNGGEMLALAIGGCFCNDLRYVAHELGLTLDAIAVDVSIAIDGGPPVVTGATLRVAIETEAGGADVSELLRRAWQSSTIGNSVRRGFPVTLLDGE